MAYFVDKVVICDAYQEPNKHYELLPGGKSRLMEGRRPSKRYVATAKDAKAGITSIVGAQTKLTEDATATNEELNVFVNDLREEVREWREGEGPFAGNAYGGTALVTRRLLEWWFEREDERRVMHQRFFFCQREAIETVIYLYEVKNKHKMPETAELLRYALKLATGTGKTVVMALVVTWATLHRAKVSGSSLTNNFLVLTPNLTVRDRVSGNPRGDGLDPTGAENLYDAFAMVPPEYRDDFQPNVAVKNWQSISLDAKRDDWIEKTTAEEGRFLPASVVWAMQRRQKQDPHLAARQLLGGAKDVIVLNDEAHHVYGEKKAKKGEQPEYIKWTKILHSVSKAARVPLVVDVSATPWYGSGSTKAEGTLFEWLVCDFSVYDAFESGLVKVVRMPDPSEAGKVYIDLWDSVKDAKTPDEYLSAAKGAIESIYSSWLEAYNDWKSSLDAYTHWEPSPVLLVIADNAKRAKWLAEHISKNFKHLRNPDSEDPEDWLTIQIDSKVFDANRGKEAILRQMVNTVGKRGQPGENVRCIVSVMMLSEGWDVKSVTHILGLRAFGSPLLTEQMIGRGLRRTSYADLAQPLDKRSDIYEETVDALGIPFVGFPVQRKKRAKAGSWGQKPFPIELDPKKMKHRMVVPNVRSWAVGVTKPLVDAVNVHSLATTPINPKETPPRVTMKPVVGSSPDDEMDLGPWRQEYPVLKTKFMITSELLERTTAQDTEKAKYAPTFDEVFPLVDAYVDNRVLLLPGADPRDVGIYKYRSNVIDILHTAIHSSADGAVEIIPVLGHPEELDTDDLKRFSWTGVLAPGKKTVTNRVPCANEGLEKPFAEFLDKADDVVHYVKNERFGFSLTYYDKSRPRQYFPDFIVEATDVHGKKMHWVVETKGETRQVDHVKRQAAEHWCARMSQTKYGTWKYLFVQQKHFEKLMKNPPPTLHAVSIMLQGMT